jgi:hypothetical protein
MASAPSILVSDQEYHSGPVTVLFGRAAGSSDLEVFVKVAIDPGEAPPDFAIVRLACSRVTHRELSAAADEKPTLLDTDVWIVRTQIVNVAPGTFVGTAVPFNVPAHSRFTLEVTLGRKHGDVHKFGSPPDAPL